MPPRTHPPGEVFIYSNYGYALAALIVEEISGTPFDQYVEQNSSLLVLMKHLCHRVQARKLPGR